MRYVLPALVVVNLACAPEPNAPAPTQFGAQQGLAACTDDVLADHPDDRCFTWRAVGGVSMGGGTAARLGFRYPELFDIVADMGGPVSDGEFFFGMLETNHLTGFCSLEVLEQAIADGKDLDDASDPTLWCGTHDEWPLPAAPNDHQAAPGYLVNVPGSDCAMFRSDYSHWYRGPKEGRGGGFGRNTLIESIADLTNIYGNVLYDNPDSNYAPPGVPEEFLVPPQDEVAVADRCANPMTVPGLINREYNPDGAYDAVTFCDGETEPPAEFLAEYQARGLSPDAARDQWKGNYMPGASSRVMDFALAMDINGNGKRDFAEPIVFNNRERWRDYGPDGLKNESEPGYDADTNPDPARDDFDTLTNPEGPEGNLRHDEGEPYDDDGLDGVPATGDTGEGNGAYDIAPNLKSNFDRSPREYWKKMSDAQVARMDVWLDAGIRDFLNTAQTTNQLYAELAKRAEAKVFEDFPNLPGIDGDYLYLNADYSREAMGQVTYLRYGDASICPSSDSVLGDGNHVGPDVVNRLFTLFSFLSERMPAQGRNEAIGGEISDLESPTGTLTDFAFMTSYDSEVLGKQYDYGVLLPPDYFFNTDERYPVLYFFHGQGMDADGMSATGLALFGPMKESGRSDRVQSGLTDLQRAIIIWVDGECPPDVCWTGNFYADFEGLPRNDRRYESAFYELMRHVEDNYRIKAPELIPLDDIE